MSARLMFRRENFVFCDFLRSTSYSACLILCGCFDSNPAPESGTIVVPFKGQEVELLAPKSLGLPALWEVMLQEWSSQTGANIRWTEYSVEDEPLLAKMLEQTSSSGGRVALLPLARLSDVEQSLAPLYPESQLGLESKDIFKGLRDRIMSRNRFPIAIPLEAPVLVCYFRRDLLQAAGLKPPQTWEDYQTLLDSMDRWATGLTAVEPLGPKYRATTFFARSLAYAKHPENYSVWFDLETGESLVQSPGFVAALEASQRAWKVMPSSIREMSPDSCRLAVLEGRAALAIGYEPTTAEVVSPQVRRAPGLEIGICRIPGTRRVFNRNSMRWEQSEAGQVHAPGLCGMKGLVAGVTLPTADFSGAVACWNLLKTLVEIQFDSSWATLPKTPCRESQAISAINWHENGLVSEEASQYVDTVAQTLRDTQVVADLPLPRADEFRSATELAILRVLQNESEPSEALSDLKREFDRLATEFGIDKFRASYRRGLGLGSENTLGLSPVE